MTEPKDHPAPEVTVEPVGDGTLSVGPLSQESLAQVPGVLGKIGAEFQAALVGAGREAGRQLAAMARALQSAGDAPPPPAPLSPRERALLARQNRHTGPPGNGRRRRGR